MKLFRVAGNHDRTYGVLVDGPVAFAVTLERGWNNNIKNTSCIPDGKYLCKRVDSPRFGNTFEVTGVKGRSSILFHWGNFESDSRGCILVGESYDYINGREGILQSKKGFEEFMKRLEGVDSFELVIRSVL